MPSFPQDQFDELTTSSERVGAHRAPRRRGRAWIRFAWAALATGVLVVVGLVAISLVDPNFRLLPEASGPAPTSAAPTDPAAGVDPVVDPGTVDPALELSLTILNGTATADLQDVAGDQLEGIGWPVVSRANASVDTEETTVVYYRTAEFEGIALGIAEQLGTETVQLSDAYQGSPVTVVLGADYTPPAG